MSNDVGWKVVGARTGAFPVVRADMGSTVFMELGLAGGREASTPSRARPAQTLDYVGVCDPVREVIAPVPSQLCVPQLASFQTDLELRIQCLGFRV